ncbi:MAG: hypothetical protein SFY92_11865 [Verrucomicrobiae bacterium]|nr:hypothetical protein [Verrucomicrobiae bacterium]
MNTPSADLTIIELVSGSSSARICPELGSQLISWNVNGEELIHLEADFQQLWPDNNLWGNPILFPNPGSCNIDNRELHWRDGTKILPMAFHGFGDKLPWKLQSQSAERVTVVLEASEATRPFFPYDFTLTQTIRLTPSAIEYTLTAINHSAHPMPFGVGWHPYFKRLRNAEGHPRAWRVAMPPGRRWVNDGIFESYPGGTISSDDRLGIGSVLVFDHEKDVTMHTDDPSLGSLVISTKNFAAPGKPYVWVLWNIESGADYLCVEPWSCPPNVLNSPPYQYHVKPESPQTVEMRFERITAKP